MTVAEVVKTLHTNAAHSRAVAEGLLQKVHDHVAAGKLDQIKGSMQWSCVTAKDVSLSRQRRWGLEKKMGIELILSGSAGGVEEEARIHLAVLQGLEV